MLISNYQNITWLIYSKAALNLDFSIKQQQLKLTLDNLKQLKQTLEQPFTQLIPFHFMKEIQLELSGKWKVLKLFDLQTDLLWTAFHLELLTGQIVTMVLEQIGRSRVMEMELILSKIEGST